MGIPNDVAHQRELHWKMYYCRMVSNEHLQQHEHLEIFEYLCEKGFQFAAQDFQSLAALAGVDAAQHRGGLVVAQRALEDFST